MVWVCWPVSSLVGYFVTVYNLIDSMCYDWRHFYQASILPGASVILLVPVIEMKLYLGSNKALISCCLKANGLATVFSNCTWNDPKEEHWPCKVLQDQLQYLTLGNFRCTTQLVSQFFCAIKKSELQCINRICYIWGNVSCNLTHTLDCYCLGW